MIIANPTPIYPGSVLTATLRVAALNADRTGATGTLNTLLTAVAAAAGGKGALVQRINIISAIAVGTSTAQVARLYRVAAGGTVTLEDEVLLASLSPATAVVGTRSQFNRTNILLAAGEALKITQTVAENVDYAAEYGEY